MLTAKSFRQLQVTATSEAIGYVWVDRNSPSSIFPSDAAARIQCRHHGRGIETT